MMRHEASTLLLQKGHLMQYSMYEYPWYKDSTSNLLTSLCKCTGFCCFFCASCASTVTPNYWTIQPTVPHTSHGGDVSPRQMYFIFIGSSYGQKGFLALLLLRCGLKRIRTTSLRCIAQGLSGASYSHGRRGQGKEKEGTNKSAPG